MASKNDGKSDSGKRADAAPRRAPAPATSGRVRESLGASRNLRRSDETLAREIYEILTQDPELDATEIEVDVQGGAVTLTGIVEHPDAKLLAEELVESITGVREIHNHLKVAR